VALLEINDLDSVGVVRDMEGYMLPPEGLTLGENVRLEGGGVARLAGKTQIFGTPGVAPHFALPIQSPSQVYWLYVSLLKAYVYDGSTHTNITRQTASVDVDYTASNTREWNGTLLGNIPILNNGVDTPQHWSSINPATKLTVLPNWNVNHRTRVMRAFSSSLVACYVTKSGTVFPHMVKWSHPADPGAVPVSWDETDATKDTGEVDLPDVEAGVIMDALPLQGRLFIYKEHSAWRMTFVGGNAIFRFDTLLETAGVISQRAVTLTGDGRRHVFASVDDILIHNGNSADTILEKRYKKYLFNQIDIDNYLNCFMFTNSYKDEVWFCYPEQGQVNPNRALIWNYKVNGFTEAAINFRNVARGVIETASADTWSSVVGTWAGYTGPWSQAQSHKLVALATDTTKFLQFDRGTTNDGSAYTATIQREGLGLVGKKRNGEPIVDFSLRKLVTRVWLKLVGGPVNVRVGFQETPEGPVTWGAAQSFNPTTQSYVDVVGSGMAVAIEIQTTDSVEWKLLGYKPEIEVIGDH
jgi:hypothetical protein